MAGALFSWVKNIVVFLLLLTLINELLPTSDYRKYIRVTAGMILILIVMSPLLKLFGANGSMDYFYQWENFKSVFAGNFTDFNQAMDGEDMDALRWEAVLSEYRENLTDQIMELLENQGYAAQGLEIEVNEDTDSEDFGRVDGLKIWGLSYGSSGEAENGIVPVTPVNVETTKIAGEEAFDESAVSDDEILELKRKLSADYGISMSRIYVETGGK